MLEIKSHYKRTSVRVVVGFIIFLVYLRAYILHIHCSVSCFVAR